MKCPSDVQMDILVRRVDARTWSGTWARTHRGFLREVSRPPISADIAARFARLYKGGVDRPTHAQLSTVFKRFGFRGCCSLTRRFVYEGCLRPFSAGQPGWPHSQRPPSSSGAPETTSSLQNQMGASTRRPHPCDGRRPHDRWRRNALRRRIRRTIHPTAAPTLANPPRIAASHRSPQRGSGTIGPARRGTPRKP